jgi:sec-independent protein translocase protein TatC
MAENPDSHTMPLLDHLIELRSRLIWSIVAFLVAFFACFYAAQPIYNFLVTPLAQVMEEVGGTNRMIYTALTEAFFTHIMVAFFAAVCVSFPIFATQLWLFIAPGLYKHEKGALAPFLIASPILFTAGASFVYYFIMPMAWRFLLGFQTGADEGILPIELEARVGEYLSLVMKLILAFGISFQLPVLLVLLARVGIVSADGLVEKRKYAIVGVFVFAAVVTPPDVISQIGLAIPMMLLYELSIFACRIVERKREEAWAVDAEDDGFEDTDFNEA